MKVPTMNTMQLMKRLDEIQMHAPDRAAAKARMAQAERLVDGMFAAAAGLKRWGGALVVRPIRRGIAKIRRSSREAFELIP